jgi:hypothetical protein
MNMGAVCFHASGQNTGCDKCMVHFKDFSLVFVLIDISDGLMIDYNR